MISRTLVAGDLHRPLFRKRKIADGSIFGIATIRDRDRLETRFWKAFVNDLEIIERFERLRVGEPVAVSGPFSIVTDGPADAPRVEHRISVHAMIDTHAKKKTKRQIRGEEKIASDEHKQAPSAVEEGLNDEIPF